MIYDLNIAQNASATIYCREALLMHGEIGQMLSERLEAFEVSLIAGNDAQVSEVRNFYDGGVSRYDDIINEFIDDVHHTLTSEHSVCYFSPSNARITDPLLKAATVPYVSFLDRIFLYVGYGSSKKGIYDASRWTRDFRSAAFISDYATNIVPFRALTASELEEIGSRVTRFFIDANDDETILRMKAK